MTTYTIERNPQFNSIEVYFSGKPAEAVRDALKALRMRWHRVKSCWYGFADEETVKAAICAAEGDTQPAGIISEGYMGATKWTGSKSRRNLTGAELTEAIRKDLKAAGIKGVTVRRRGYAGGQSITVTLRTTEADYITEEEFMAAYRVNPSEFWIYLDERGTSVHRDQYFNMSGEEQEAVRIAAGRREYRRQTDAKTSEGRHHRHLTAATEALKDTITRIENIVLSYRYDDSNSMVDYYDTNFYYDINVKSNIVREEATA